MSKLLNTTSLDQGNVTMSYVAALDDMTYNAMMRDADALNADHDMRNSTAYVAAMDAWHAKQAKAQAQAQAKADAKAKADIAKAQAKAQADAAKADAKAQADAMSRLLADIRAKAKAQAKADAAQAQADAKAQADAQWADYIATLSDHFAILADAAGGIYHGNLTRCARSLAAYCNANNVTRKAYMAAGIANGFDPTTLSVQWCNAWMSDAQHAVEDMADALADYLAESDDADDADADDADDANA
jgi:membrane protein involved in colicin uptake